MLKKKQAFTVITPIPSFIPRQLALDILHSHSEVITLNPLVLDHKPIPAPRDAPADEFYSTWYEITQRIQVVPGVGNVGSRKITFNGCFHNMPWGLQTHVHAPFDIDMRSKYRIAGNQMGIEPPEPREIGLEALGAPAEGLYLREDIEIRCNIGLVSFVKGQAKAANRDMVQRIVKKAELLDAGLLTAMIEDGKLKTYNPNDHSRPAAAAAAGVERANSNAGPRSPGAVPYRPPSLYPTSPTKYQHPGQELPGDREPVELAGDYQQYQSYNPKSPAQQSKDVPPAYRQSVSFSDSGQKQG